MPLYIHPYAMKLADKGLAALHEDTGFAKDVNTYQGYVTYKPVAQDLGLMERYKPFSSRST